MTMSDPLGDMLTRIRNGQRAHQAVVASPASKLRTNVLDVLQREGYIRGFSREQVRPWPVKIRLNTSTVSLSSARSRGSQARAPHLFETGRPAADL